MTASWIRRATLLLVLLVYATGAAWAQCDEDDVTRIYHQVMIGEGYDFNPVFEVPIVNDKGFAVNVQYQTYSVSALNEADQHVIDNEIKQDYTHAEGGVALNFNGEAKIPITIFSSDKKLSHEDIELFARDAYHNWEEFGEEGIVGEAGDVDARYRFLESEKQLIDPGYEDGYPEFGYYMRTRFINSSTGLKAYLFTSVEQFEVVLDFYSQLSGDCVAIENHTVRIYDMDKPPILAFRGTEFGAPRDWNDFWSNLNVEGIGYDQYKTERAAMTDALKLAANPEDRFGSRFLDTVEYQPVITGHSLGGAVAQWFASYYSNQVDGYIGRVVTFNAPGIKGTPDDCDYCNDPFDSEEGAFNAKYNKIGKVSHYIVRGDPVSMAGNVFMTQGTSGYIQGFEPNWALHEYKSPEGIGDMILNKHMSPILFQQATPSGYTWTEGVLNTYESVSTLSETFEETPPNAINTHLNSECYTFLNNEDYFRIMVTLARTIRVRNLDIEEGIKVARAMVFRDTIEESRKKLGEQLPDTNLWYEIVDFAEGLDEMLEHSANKAALATAIWRLASHVPDSHKCYGFLDNPGTADAFAPHPDTAPNFFRASLDWPIWFYEDLWTWEAPIEAFESMLFWSPQQWTDMDWLEAPGMSAAEWRDTVGGAILSGTVWEDANADGDRDLGENGIEGVRVWLDGNPANGVWDEAESSAVTESDGSWQLTGILPGTYEVRRELEGGWTVTSPAEGFRTVDVGVDSTHEGLDLGSVCSDQELCSPVPDQHPYTETFINDQMFIRSYSDIPSWTTFEKTDIPSADWLCGIGGYQSTDGNINENENDTIIRATVSHSEEYVRYSIDFISEAFNESWDRVDLVCLSRDLVSDNTPDPDKPFVVQFFDDLGDDFDYQTDFDTENYHCGLFEYAAYGGMINANKRRHIMVARAYENAETGHWHMRGEFRSRNREPENWSMRLLCSDRDLVANWFGEAGKPMVTRRLVDIPRLVPHDTGFPKDEWVCFIDGLEIYDGDINENSGTEDRIIQAYMQEGATNWEAVVSFKTHGSEGDMENWNVDILCHRKGVPTVDGSVGVSATPVLEPGYFVGLSAEWAPYPDAAEYRVTRSWEDSCGSESITETTSATEAVTSTVLNCGAPDTCMEHAITVEAYSENGILLATGTDSFCEIGFSDVPAAPEDLVVSGEDSALSLSWSEPSLDGGAPVTLYEYEISGVYDSVFISEITTGTSATEGGLQNGNLYEVRVRAQNEHGWGAWTDYVEGTPQVALSVTSTPYFEPGFFVGNRATWTAVSGATSYRVTHYREDACGSQEDTTTTTNTRSSSGLHGNCGAPEHCYLMRATVEALNSGNAVIAVGSDEFCEVGDPAPGPPEAPTDVTVTSRDGALDFTWLAPLDDGASPITSYEYQVEPVGGGSILSGTSETTSASQGGLQNGTAYNVRVRAGNIHGFGPWSADVAGTPIGVVSVSATPDLESGYMIGLTANWPAYSGATSYRVTHSYSASCTSGSEEETTSATSSSSSLAFNCDAPELCLTREAKVEAYNAVGTLLAEGTASFCEVGDAGSTLPGAPTNLVVTPGDGALSFTWDAPSDSGSGPILSYEYEVIAEDESRDIGTSNTTSATQGGLQNGQTYYVRVRAENKDGFGPWTLEVPGTPQVPLTVTATPYYQPGYLVGNRATWSAVSGATQYRVTHVREDDCGSETSVVTTTNTRSSSGLHENCGAPDSCYLMEATVEALDAAGNVLASGTDSFCEVGEPAENLPGAPEDLAVSPQDGALSFNWKEPGDTGGAPILSYEYEVTPISGGSAEKGTSTTESAYQGSLSNGTTYNVKVRAENENGFGPWSAEVPGTPAGDFDVTATPDFAPGYDVGLTASWGTVSGATSYRVTHYHDGGCPGDPSEVTVTVGGTASSSALDENCNGESNVCMTRSVTVEALNSGNDVIATGSAEFCEVGEPDAPTPGAPTNLVVVPNDSALWFTWDAPADTGGLPLTYQYEITGVYDNIDVTGTSDTDSAWHGGLINGNLYEVRVRAQNDNGFGPWTDYVEGTPEGDFDITASPDFAPGYDVGLTASWNTYSGATSYRVTHYYEDNCGSGSDTVTVTGTTSSSALHNNCGAPGSCMLRRATVEALNSGNAVIATGSAEFCEVGEPDAPTPGAPTNLVVVPNDSALWFTWDAPADTGGLPLTYQYEITGVYDNIDVTGTSDTDSAWHGGLINGNLYEVRVRAQNDNGYGPWTDYVEGTPEGDFDVTATPDFAPGYNVGLTASWNTYSGATSYRVTHVHNGGCAGDPGEVTVTVSGTTSSSALDENCNGESNVCMTRSVTVEALNSGNAVIATASAEFCEVGEPAGSVPGAPTNVNAHPNDSALYMTWDAPGDDGGSTITLYEYEITGVYDNIDITDTSNTTSAWHGGLTNGNLYEVRVRAQNQHGWGSWSNYTEGTPTGSFTVTATPYFEPGYQVGLTASWVPIPGAAEYRVVHTHLDSCGSGSVTVTTTLDSSNSGLDYNCNAPDTCMTREANVEALNAQGVVMAVGSASFCELGEPAEDLPGAPTNLIVTPGDGGLNFTWNAPADTGGSVILGYEYQVIAEDDSSIHTGTSTNESAYQGGLQNGLTYYVKVRAENKDGWGPWSTEVAGTPDVPRVPGVPLNLVAVGEDGALFIDWSVPSDPGSAEILDYEYELEGIYDNTSRSGTPTTTSAWENDLINGYLYEVRVRARNVHGYGPWTNWVEGMPTK